MATMDIFYSLISIYRIYDVSFPYFADGIFSIFKEGMVGWGLGRIRFYWADCWGRGQITIFSFSQKCIFALADPRGGARDARPHWGSKFFFFFMQFSAKIWKIITILGLGAPPWGKSWIRHCFGKLIVSSFKKFLSFILAGFPFFTCHSLAICCIIRPLHSECVEHTCFRIHCT